METSKNIFRLIILLKVPGSATIERAAINQLHTVCQAYKALIALISYYTDSRETYYANKGRTLKPWSG